MTLATQVCGKFKKYKMKVQRNFSVANHRGSLQSTSLLFQPNILQIQWTQYLSPSTRASLFSRVSPYLDQVLLQIVSMGTGRKDH